MVNNLIICRGVWRISNEWAGIGSHLVLLPILGVLSHHPRERVYVLLAEHPVLVRVEHP